MPKKIYCDNCNYKLTKEHITDEESVENYYKDLATGQVYSDIEDITSDHSVALYEMIEITYECPKCKNNSREIIHKFVKNIE